MEADVRVMGAGFAALDSAFESGMTDAVVNACAKQNEVGEVRIPAAGVQACQVRQGSARSC